MIIAALMFVFGAWNVQQLAQLPSIYWLCCAFAMSVMILLTQNHSRFSHYFHTPKFLKEFLLCAAAFIFGVCWASALALWRMNDELPHTWEQQTIKVIGVVASVPEATERGTRFKFDVEKILTKDALVPQHISLNQYSAYQSYGNKPHQLSNAKESSEQLTPFKAGEHWQLFVRLKRPHGTANPHVRVS